MLSYNILNTEYKTTVNAYSPGFAVSSYLRTVQYFHLHATAELGTFSGLVMQFSLPP